MKFFWGLLIAFVFITASFNVEMACAGDHSSKTQLSIVDHDSHSKSSSNTNSEECPMNCHNIGGHCHSACFHNLNPASVSLESREDLKLGISAEFRIPADPHLEGNRKPPKIS